MSPLDPGPDPARVDLNVGVDVNEAVYVISHPGGGTTVTPWDEVQRMIERYSIELLLPRPPAAARGSIEAYDTMVNLQAALKQRFDRTGEVATSELSGLLSGLEGKTVRVLTVNDEEREFTVGISDGWMPHHIEVRRDGPAVRADPDYKRCWVKGEDG